MLSPLSLSFPHSCFLSVFSYLVLCNPPYGISLSCFKSDPIFKTSPFLLLFLKASFHLNSTGACPLSLLVPPAFLFTWHTTSTPLLLIPFFFWSGFSAFFLSALTQACTCHFFFSIYSTDPTLPCHHSSPPQCQNRVLTSVFYSGSC